MMSELTEGHIVKRYNDELEELNQMVIKMAGLVRGQIRDATTTLEEEDAAAAHLVVKRDRAIDALEVEIDDKILHLIAKRQPVAKDLRELLAVGKIVSDLERIGDQARRLARLTILFYEGDNSLPNHQLITDIPKLAKLVDSMVEKSMLAFETLDPGLALEVIRTEGELDEEMKSALRRLSTFLLEDARSVGYVVDITLTLRALERIGGHAKYIARHSIFLVKGRDVRHESLERVTAEVVG
jgi:phosphate transport system protein